MIPKFFAQDNVYLKIFRQAVFYGLLYAAWQGFASMKMWPSYLFPSPAQVWETLCSIFRDGSLWSGVGATMGRLLAGYGISVVFGVLLGLLIGKVRVLDETLGGFFVGLQTLPSICWLPLAILWFGLGESAILFVVIMGSLLSVSIATDSGVKNIQPLFLRAGLNMGAKGKDMFLQVVLPAAMPSILGGLKQGWSFAWRALMGAEIVFSTVGLGHLLNVGRELNDMSQVMAVMVVITAIGIFMDVLVFGALEKKVRRVWGLEKAKG